MLEINVSKAAISPWDFFFFPPGKGQRTNSFSHRGLDRQKPQRTLSRGKFAPICPGKVSLGPMEDKNRLILKYIREDQN